MLYLMIQKFWRNVLLTFLVRKLLVEHKNTSVVLGWYEKPVVRQNVWSTYASCVQKPMQWGGINRPLSAYRTDVLLPSICGHGSRTLITFPNIQFCENYYSKGTLQLALFRSLNYPRGSLSSDDDHLRWVGLKRRFWLILICFDMVWDPYTQ